MKICDVISAVNSLMPNEYDDAQKIAWLNEVDGQVYREVVQTHEIEASFTGYSEGTNQNTVLLVPEPYSQLYQWYLMAQIDLANQEINKYNNHISLFNSAYLTYQDFANRTAAPKRKTKFFKVW